MDSNGAVVPGMRKAVQGTTTCTCTPDRVLVRGRAGNGRRRLRHRQRLHHLLHRVGLLFEHTFPPVPAPSLSFADVPSQVQVPLFYEV
ncbi:unnamed protein product [Urochloa humidicola]